MARYESGDYLLLVTNQGFGESKTKQTPYFFIEGEPVALIERDGQQYATDERQRRTIYIYITDKTEAGARKKLEELGWPGGRWSTLDPMSANHHSFIDQEIQVHCSMEPGLQDSSKLFEKWELPYESQASESNPEVASKLDVMFGKAAPKKAPVRKPAPEAQPESDANRAMQEAAAADDIPF